MNILSRSLRVSFVSTALALAGAAVVVNLAGCSAGADSGSETLDILGEDGEAISLWNGYGFDVNQNRCWFAPGLPAWGGGKCFVPSRKEITYTLLKSTCSGPLADDYIVAMDSAYNYVFNTLSLQGFTVHKDTAVRGVDSIVSCSRGGASNALGDSTLAVAGDCQSTPHGQLCKFGKMFNFVFQSKIDPIISGVAQAKRRVFIEDQFRHEMMHAAGLGHDVCGGDPVTNLMNRPASCQDNFSDPRTWSLANLVKFERDMLFTYAP